MRTFWMVCVLASVACGRKNDNDDLKKQAIAVRDKVRACKDKACVSAGVADYTDLTKNYSKLSDADSQFFADIGVELRTLELNLEHPAAAAARTMGPGFSVELPAGWETREVDRPNVVLTAANGSSLETMTTLAIMRGPKNAEFNTKASCDALGTDQAATFKGKLEATRLLTLAGGSCILRITRDKRDSLIAIIPDGPSHIFYAMCDGPAGDKTLQDQCPGIFASWKAEP